jgi:propionyl-CoA carboxylase beta chain
MDEGSFEKNWGIGTHRTTDFGMQNELHYGEVITGYGTINGRLTYVAQDFTVFGQNVTCREKSVKWIWSSNGAPMIGLNDSGGARRKVFVHSVVMPIFL